MRNPHFPATLLPQSSTALSKTVEVTHSVLSPQVLVKMSVFLRSPPSSLSNKTYMTWSELWQVLDGQLCESALICSVIVC